MKTTLLTRSTLSTRYLLALPLAALLSVACGGDDPVATTGNGDGGAHPDGAVASDAGADSGNLDGATGLDGNVADAGPYMGPSVGRAGTFAALAYGGISAANITTITGELGVSAAAVSTITGFSAPSYVKYGNDSLAPNDMRTLLAQQDVTALVGNINPRACDSDLTNVVGGLTGDITLHPGVTCMNDFSADVLINGHVTLDARGNPNAFFIIRGNKTLTVADGAEIILANGAEACGVFWRISAQVTIGKTVKFYGTVIAGTAITMNTASTLTGRALAQTANVSFDANAVTIPTNGLVGAPGVCTHVQ